MCDSTGPVDDAVVLICGLGRLGQHCARILKEFGVTLHGIEAQARHHWAVPELPSLLDRIVVGDCRLPGVLEQADVGRCRAILLVTGDERTNIAAAFAARSVNPQVRVVLRSAQEALNTLLCQTLGNFVAFEPTQLSINAFTLAGLGDETVGLFTVDDQLFPVLRRVIAEDDPWYGRRLHEIDKRGCRVLTHAAAAGSSRPGRFYEWDPEDEVLAGDVITYIELGRGMPALTEQPRSGDGAVLRTLLRGASWPHLRRAVTRFWREGSRIRRVNFICGGVLIGLYLAGALLYKLHYPEIGLRDALNVPMVLVLGGYDNLFGQLTVPFESPVWLNLFSLGLTVAGTLFMGIVYATLTEQVLSARFRFRQQRPPLPKANHVVLVGLSRVGRQVAGLLYRLNQPVIGVNDTELPAEALPHLPIVTGNLREGLQRVNLLKAKSLMAVTDDEVVNLEIALAARLLNSTCRLVIRMDDPAFGGGVTDLLPGARAFGTYALAAEAFAAAALGETVHGLLHLGDTTVLVTEYTVTAGDTLDGRLLPEIAYGYGLVPILHRRAGRDDAELLPVDDLDVLAGDRLVVLATKEGLRSVERGLLEPRTWRVHVESVLSQDSAFEAAIVIARVSGCEMSLARTLMSRLPGTLEVPLYRHQALRLVHELCRVGSRASLISDPSAAMAEG